MKIGAKENEKEKVTMHGNFMNVVLLKRNFFMLEIILGYPV
jgi:hypothetical protein